MVVLSHDEDPRRIQQAADEIALPGQLLDPFRQLLAACGYLMFQRLQLVGESQCRALQNIDLILQALARWRNGSAGFVKATVSQNG